MPDSLQSFRALSELCRKSQCCHHIHLGHTAGLKTRRLQSPKSLKNQGFCPVFSEMHSGHSEPNNFVEKGHRWSSPLIRPPHCLFLLGLARLRRCAWRRSGRGGFITHNYTFFDIGNMSLVVHVVVLDHGSIILQRRYRSSNLKLTSRSWGCGGHTHPTEYGQKTHRTAQCDALWAKLLWIIQLGGVEEATRSKGHRY